MSTLRDAVRSIDELPRLVGDAKLVLLGEASHGTHEFYALRAEVTRCLVAEHGFRGVAVEADWPAAAVRARGDQPATSCTATALLACARRTRRRRRPSGAVDAALRRERLSDGYRRRAIES